MSVTMPPIGWTPENTATHARSQERLSEWTHRQAYRQGCAWCWGQGVLWQRSDDLRAFIPVTCPHCGPR